MFFLEKVSEQRLLSLLFPFNPFSPLYALFDIYALATIVAR